MKEPQNCKIDYCGYENPETPDEINFEIYGLELAIAECNKRIATLKQSLFFAQMVTSEIKNDHICKSEK